MASIKPEKPPIVNRNKKPNAQPEVLFFGTYIPLQGIEHILDAAEILQTTSPKVHITLLGSGQTKREMLQIAEEKKLQNITFRGRVSFEEIIPIIQQADLTLGIFGTSGKARRVIPHKVYDSLACGVPVVTEDSPAIREKYADDEKVILCKAGDGVDLAAKIAQFFS